MRIAIATPLYPPDTAPTSLYVKDLAARLAAGHDVSVLAYTFLPEAVSGVRMQTVAKRAPLPVRLFLFTRALIAQGRRSDLVLAVNGASVDLPLLVFSFVSRTPFVVLLRDTAAAERSFLLSLLGRMARNRAVHTVTAFPPLRPEILPLEPAPVDAQDAYERAWVEHRHELSTYGA